MSSDVKADSNYAPVTYTIYSTNKLQRVVLGKDQDARIIVDPGSGGFANINQVKVEGGRNVVLTGGHLRRIDNTPTNDLRTGKRAQILVDNELKDTGVAVLSFFDQTGTVTVEGLLIDNNLQWGVDAIAVGSTSTNPADQKGSYVFRNVRIENVHGDKLTINKKELNHADGLQLQGPVKLVDIKNMTVYSSYQAFNFEPKDKQFGLVTLTNVNTHYIDPDRSKGYANGVSFWLGTGTTIDGLQPATYKFKSVYIDPRADKWNSEWAINSISPQLNAKTTKGIETGAQYYDKSKNSVIWPWIKDPLIKISGLVYKGVPPKGDYVPRSKIVDDSGKVIYKPQ